MIELYKLTQGATTRATITSSPDDVTFGGETYESTAVKRSRIIIRPDLLQNKVTLQMSVHTMLGLDLLAEVNNNLSHKLTIYRGQDVASLSQIWAGSLTEQSCNGEVAILTYGGGGIALRQLGDRRPFQRRCPFILYDPLTCRAMPQTVAGAVTSINATKDIVGVSGLDTHDVGYFTGGVLCPSATYSRDNAGNSFVSSHNKTADADELRLTTPIDVAVGDNISVLAGCDRTWQTCYSKFSNIVNFGGFPFMPLENPYIAEVCSDDGVTAVGGAGDGDGDGNGNGNGNGDENGDEGDSRTSSCDDLDNGGNATPEPYNGTLRIAVYFEEDSRMHTGRITFPAGQVKYASYAVTMFQSLWSRLDYAIRAGTTGQVILAARSWDSEVATQTNSIGGAAGLYRQGGMLEGGSTFGGTTGVRASYAGMSDRFPAVSESYISDVFGYPQHRAMWRFQDYAERTPNTRIPLASASAFFGMWNYSSTTRVPVSQNIRYPHIGGAGGQSFFPYSASDREILIIIGSAPLRADSVTVARQTALYAENAPFASPFNVEIYAVSFGGSSLASQLGRITNTESPVVTIQNSYEEDAPDPAILYNLIMGLCG